MRIGPQAIREFLRDGLRRKIVSDLRRKLIVSEADLHSCVYYHIRRFLRRDSKWAIFSKAFIQGLSIYPDILLKRRGVPRIAIELKEKRTMRADWFKADMRKLQVLWSRGQWPIIGFLICLVRERRQETVLRHLAEFEWRIPGQRKHVFPIIINVRDHLRDWHGFREWWRRHAKTRLGT